MIKVAIATNSYEKIEGIVEGFSRFFQLKKSEIEILFMTTDSEVPEQPFNSEIYAGAYNRVDNIRKKIKEWDYYVSCEAGIEGYNENYFNVQVVCIFETKTKKYLLGKSAGWQVPSEDIETIEKINLDKYLKGKGFRNIEEILGTSYPRSESVAQATELALASKKLL